MRARGRFCELVEVAFLSLSKSVATSRDAGFRQILRTGFYIPLH